MRTSAAAAAVPLMLLLSLAPGCARSRTFTIYSKPADAKLVIDGVERGPGPITQRFSFGGSSSAVRVMAVRDGYRPTVKRLTANTLDDTIVIELEPLGPKIDVSIQPPAMVRVNGRLYSPTPVRQAQIPIDPNVPVYTVTAEQTGYTREERTFSSKDPPGYYRIVLKPLRPDDGTFVDARPPDRGPQRIAQSQPSRPQPSSPPPATRQAPVARADPPPFRNDPPVVPQPQPQPQAQPLRRDIVIRTEPATAGAEIYIGGQKWGDREVSVNGHEFKRDPGGRPLPQQVSATAPGFEGGQVTMRWEDNRQLYVIPLGRRRKEVRIATDPPGATVTLNGKALPKDRTGVSTDTVYFPPEDPPQRPTTISGTAAPADPSAPFEPTPVTIRWDEGRRDYLVKLPPSRYVNVPALQVTPTWEARGGWRAGGSRTDTRAARDTSEGPARPAPQPLTELPAGTMLGSVIASPDGTLLLYTELIARDGQPLRSQMRLLNGDGTAGAGLSSDGRHFDAMPSFTPDGGEIVFTSDRSGEGLDVWSMAVASGGAVKQLARGGEKAALWPMIDASPSPRLFYEEFRRQVGAATEARSEVHMVELEANPPTNRALSPGNRPRASPRADAVVFTRADPGTGKRDLYLISERGGASFGGEPLNLTMTPDVDEYDPAWSRTGGKIAYASDAGSDEHGRRNYDVYVLTVSNPNRPVRVTHNGSLDDSPAWDPAGNSVYFRSNRGGKWGIWKARVP